MLRLSQKDFLLFPRIDEGQSVLDLQSLTNVPITFKLKTTSPEKFSVKPIAGILKKGESVKVTINLKPGHTIAESHGKDKFLVLVMPVPVGVHQKEPLKIWKENLPHNSYIEETRLVCAYKTNSEVRRDERQIPWFKEETNMSGDRSNRNAQKEPQIEHENKKEPLVEQNLQTEPAKLYETHSNKELLPMPVSNFNFQTEPVTQFQPYKNEEPLNKPITDEYLQTVPLMSFNPHVTNEQFKKSKSDEKVQLKPFVPEESKINIGPIASPSDQITTQDLLGPSAEVFSPGTPMSTAKKDTDLGLMSISPNDVLIFPRGEKSLTVLKLTSLTHSTLTFMIKTTSAEKFFVKPYVGLLGPFETVSVTIKIKPEQYLDEGTTNQKFLVMAMKIPPDIDASHILLNIWKLVTPRSPYVDKHRLTCAYSAPLDLSTKSDHNLISPSEKAILKPTINPIAILPNPNTQKIKDSNYTVYVNDNKQNTPKKPEMVENTKTVVKPDYPIEHHEHDYPYGDEEDMRQSRILGAQLKITQVLQIVTLLLLFILSIGFVYLLKKQYDFEHRIPTVPAVNPTKIHYTNSPNNLKMGSMKYTNFGKNAGNQCYRRR
ncbi:uncharacterized protein LOC119668308 [Teleopsis dalmanni]|uniref:uncharacterized protein LOC119668308 n=1 Tax=Teleopsis dalmanni TaxID=139649 RepID=UPI0018CEC810|nr:uncharacterized protein LOC119668308 [Teleopsis dalmanni]